MPSGDLYQLVDEQIYVTEDDNPALNVYAYLQTAGAGNAIAIAAAWISTILPTIVAFQSTAVGHRLLTVTNLDDPSDFLEAPITSEDGNGTQSGDCLPRYNAFSFFYARATRASRNGWKRIMGIPESVQVNGEVTNSGELTALAACAAALQNPLTDEDANSWSPRIYRRARPDASPPVERADFGISGVSYQGLTTQNTRKR